MTKAEIQLVRALADKRGRAEHGLFVAEGAKLIGELRASHLRVRRIYARFCLVSKNCVRNLL